MIFKYINNTEHIDCIEAFNNHLDKSKNQHLANHNSLFALQTIWIIKRTWFIVGTIKPESEMANIATNVTHRLYRE